MVDYATASAPPSVYTATPNVDYLATSGTLTLLPGETSKTITVSVIGDTLPENNERLYVLLNSPTNALLADSKGRATINDDDGRFSINSVSRVEGNSGTTDFVFTVSLSKASPELALIGYRSEDGSATPGDDCIAVSGELLFDAGETTKTITVQVVGDTRYESEEYFYVYLSARVGNVYFDGLGWRGTGTIVNDDPAPTKPGGGKKNLTAETSTSNPVTEVLNQADATALLDVALAYWQTIGADTSTLHGLHVRIADLGGNTLAEVKGHTIWLDDNAAGWGWFVDATPWDDSEFTTPGDQGEQYHVDLLSVLEHEIGHLLGYDHSISGLMDATLTAGVRKVI